MKHPETSELAKAALAGSGARTHQEFADIYHCNVRTLRSWLAGAKRPDDMAQMVLRMAANGWTPDDMIG